MNLLALVPLPYRILALVLLVGAVWGHGYMTGTNHEQNAQAALQLAAEHDASKVSSDQAREHVAQQEANRNELENLRLRLRKMARAAPLPANCKLDAQRLHAWNGEAEDGSGGTASPVR